MVQSGAEWWVHRLMRRQTSTETDGYQNTQADADREIGGEIITLMRIVIW